jgi:predicted DNA-binding transcriptional regulator AlpA
MSNVPDILEKLISEKDYCELANLSPAQAQRQRANGTGPKFVVLSARRIAYRPSEIQKWLLSREVEQGTAPAVHEAAVAAA